MPSSKPLNDTQQAIFALHRICLVHTGIIQGPIGLSDKQRGLVIQYAEGMAEYGVAEAIAQLGNLAKSRANAAAQIALNLGIVDAPGTASPFKNLQLSEIYATAGQRILERDLERLAESPPLH